MNELPVLTERQQEIYDFIRERIAACGYPPTIREIGAHLGIRSTNGVADHLKALKRKGFLSQAGSKSRTWRPLQGGSTPVQSRRTTGNHLRVPILGRVAAGEPILAEEHAEGMLQVDPALVPRGKPIFALHVVGQSMIEAGISDGDIIFVQKRDSASTGSIVVCLVDDEATVKKYYPEPDHIRLEPANAAMRPLVLRAEAARRVQIAGVVVGVFRRM